MGEFNSHGFIYRSVQVLSITYQRASDLVVLSVFVSNCAGIQVMNECPIVEGVTPYQRPTLSRFMFLRDFRNCIPLFLLDASRDLIRLLRNGQQQQQILFALVYNYRVRGVL